MNLENAYILDTETTDNDPSVAEVIELAMIKANTGDLIINQRYKPEGPIKCGAMATHNIIAADLAGCPGFTFDLPADCQYIIGHKIGFDLEVIETSLSIASGIECKGVAFNGIKIIDTLNLSRVVFADEDSHSQMACMYRLDPAAAQKMASTAHGALADIRMNKLLLDHLCQEIGTRDPAILAELSELANIPALMTFGMHKGKTFAELPRDYIAWYKRQTDLDPWVIKAMDGAEALTLERAREMAAISPAVVRSEDCDAAVSVSLKSQGSEFNIDVMAPAVEKPNLVRRVSLLRPKAF